MYQNDFGNSVHLLYLCRESSSFFHSCLLQVIWEIVRNFDIFALDENASFLEDPNVSSGSSSSDSGLNKPTSKLPIPKHPGKPEASKILTKIKPLFSSSEDQKEDTPELITLEEEEQKAINALRRDTEDEATKTAKVEDNEYEKNENILPSSSPP